MTHYTGVQKDVFTDASKCVNENSSFNKKKEKKTEKKKQKKKQKKKENKVTAMTNLDTARAFHDACKSGAGWGVCKNYCSQNATFRSQAGVFHPPLASEPDLGGSLENYVDWLKLLATEVMPKCYVRKVVSTYVEKSMTAILSGVFHGTHTQTPKGAILPQPTNKSFASDYVLRMKFNKVGKIDSVILIWNSEWARKELGWMV